MGAGNNKEKTWLCIGAKGCGFCTFWGAVVLDDFFLRGTNRSPEKVLHKEYKKVSESEVVVGDGEWDHRGPVTCLRACKDPVVAAKSLREGLDGPKKNR